MSTIFLLYLPGRAGNLLSRLFSLGQDTMPQLPIKMLKYLTRQPGTNDRIDRDKIYEFSAVPQYYDNWQKFHRDWADFEYDAQYRLLRALWQAPQRHIIYAIHPHEFATHWDYIDRGHDKKIFYVDLDPRYDHWVAQQQEKIRFEYRENEFQQQHQLVKHYDMEKISLDRMLDSQEAFIDEYIRACDLLGVASFPERAVALYQDWKRVRT